MGGTYNPAMRCLLWIVLALWLPLQLARADAGLPVAAPSAAVAQAAQHVHSPCTPLAAGLASDRPEWAGADPECSVCHAGCAMAVPAAPALGLAEAFLDRVPALTEVASSALPGRPYRPQWRSPA